MSFLVNPGSGRVSSWLWLKRLEQLQGRPCPRCPPPGLWTFKGQALVGQLGSQTLC